MAPKQQTVTQSMDYLSKAGRLGRDDMRERAPELAPLSTKGVALFGLGCVGAPSALELARAGVRELRILDHDIVDPATTMRWPFGLSAAGRKKVDVISEFLKRDYPYTEVSKFDRKLGAARAIAMPDGSDYDVLKRVVRGTALVYDATAEMGVQYLLSDYARDAGLPYIAIDGTFGGWGGRVCRIDPKRTDGCWLCYQAALTDEVIESPPAKPAGEVQPVGCGDPTFTGAGFDLAQVALTGVRMAVSTLCEDQEAGYPPADWDVLIISFRDQQGKLIAPIMKQHKLVKHPNCPRCGAS
jgi:molybdopterin/thiamine biosynthesis adenylyltransferase